MIVKNKTKGCVRNTFSTIPLTTWVQRISIGVSERFGFSYFIVISTFSIFAFTSLHSFTKIYVLFFMFQSYYRTGSKKKDRKWAIFNKQSPGRGADRNQEYNLGNLSIHQHEIRNRFLVNSSSLHHENQTRNHMR